MNKYYYDENTDSILTIDEVKAVYDECKAENTHEILYSFEEYLNNCTDKNGSLTVITTEFDEFEEFVRISVDDEENADEDSIGCVYQLAQVIAEYLYLYWGKDSFDEYANRNFGIKF